MTVTTCPRCIRPETFLKELSDTLAGTNLNRAVKVALPEAMVKGYITRLENRAGAGRSVVSVTPSGSGTRSDVRTVQEHQPPHSPSGVCCFLKQKQSPHLHFRNPRPRFWKPFWLVSSAALLAVSVAIPG